MSFGPSYENTYFKFDLYLADSFCSRTIVNSLQFAKRSPSNNEFLLFSALTG